MASIFKVPTTKLQPGLSKLASSLFGGESAYDQGFQQELATQGKLGQAIASARLDNAKSDEIEQQAKLRDPTQLLNNALLGAGIPIDAAPDVNTYLKTGSNPKFTPLPPDQEGPDQPAPEWLGKLGSLGRQLMSVNNALAVGDKNSDNIAQAVGRYRDQALGDQVLNGTLSPLALATQKYALSGNAPYHFSEYGVGNNLTGQLDDQNPVAQRFGDLRTAETGKNVAQTGQAKAAAANSYAGVAEKQAQIKKINQDIDMGSKGVLRDTDNGLLLVDPRNGSTRPVYGQDGQPVGPKLKDVPTQANTAIITNSQNLKKIDRALALLSGKSTGDATVTQDKNGQKFVGNMRVDPEATGWKGLLPGSVVNRMDPKGVDARAEVADIGSLVLHDRSGAAVTASESPRLVPFIPLPSDDAATAQKKLRRFKQIYEEENNALSETYGPNNGYKQSQVLKRNGKPIQVEY